MRINLRPRFESSPGHSAFIFFYNQQVITIQQENQTVRSVPPRVGRSVREPPQDGSEYKTIELIALRLRDPWVGELSTPSDDGKPELRPAFGRNNGSRGSQRTPLGRELLAREFFVVDRQRR